MEIALPVIGLLGQCYSGAVQAYSLIQDAVDFPDTAEKLVIRVEVERIRFQLWGRNSGADSDTLRPGLAPFEPLIIDVLTKVQQLLCDSDRLKDSYGLVSSMDRDLHFSASERGQSGGSVSATQLSPSAVDHDALIRKTYERVRWVIVSKSRFEALILDLRHFNNNLNELLRESQFADSTQQWHFIEIGAVTRTDDVSELEALQDATQGDANCVGIYAMARRKSIVMASQGGLNGSNGLTVLARNHFNLPNDFHNLSRSVAIHRPSRKYVLIERKRYDTDISPEDKATLFFRLQRLVILLNSSPDEFPPCMGYWSEAPNHCWCLIYDSPLNGVPVSPTIPLSPEPPSLLLFLSSKDFRPPLETRLKLASTLASVFARFYGSKWLHKGVRSDNIVFPHSGAVYDIAHPIVVGFEYSRQYTEKASIDRTAHDRTHAMYRHPGYQGPAANGYRMAYDIYSLGLPLEILWCAIPRHKTHGSKVAETNNLFSSAEAERGQKTITERVRSELAFRVGSNYQEAIRWCLTRAEKDQRSGDADLAMEFYTNVVVPLQNNAGFVSDMRISPLVLAEETNVSTGPGSQNLK
ncbi:prion-inhibition and propagation-domain-containing protein [Mycena albidolilacea]|uniref:Prion-inhibition and propagation-domain-containing protein n=1 Tax=Mycena albidolilacea TaxID=1033008 RepID=A0AAD7EFK2_9AGAR|nr:prion-inhibition and propagation-domain-containing protein [Mycena albidolilacea]